MTAEPLAGRRFGRFDIQPAQRQLLVDGAPVALGARAFDVLLALFERRDRVVPKDELLDLVWPGLVVEENNLQVQISTLRKLLGPQAIATIPGRGYRFTAADASDSTPGSAAEAGQSSQSNPNNLLQPRTRFIGREAALADCTRLLHHTRLLTLTGIGGCGKTRLALQLAQQQLVAFPDGVWFVDLAPLQEAQRVMATVAVTLGVREEAGTPLIGRLTTHLAARHMLIVLDNCEHVIDAAVELIEALLAACGELTIIATSREALGVDGEQIYPVRSLSLPAATDPDAMQGSEAVRVFVDRARLALPDFTVDQQNAAAIADICRRLDGIALAIELAAARVKILSVDDIRARLDDRFRLLTGGSRALPRHQTLHAAMQWSHDHLSLPEQELFRRLSVFAGGGILTAATHVAGVSDEYEVLELLTTLHDKSLLVVDRESDAQPRYRMLETVRQYAEERLNEAGDGDETRTRHLQHYVSLVEEATLQFRGPQQGVWMARLSLEQENLLAAHAWCRHAPGGADCGLRLAGALWHYWSTSAQLERGYHLARAALDQAGDGVDSLARCRTLFSIGQLALFMGRYDDTLAHGEQCLSMARRIENAEQITMGLGLLATGLHAIGKTADAIERYEEGCELARGLDDSFWMSSLVNGLGEVHRGTGNLAIAERYYEESILISRQRGDARRTAVSLSNVARLLIAAGQLDRARATLIECWAVAETAALKGLGEHLLEISAGLASALGDQTTAARLHGAALARMRDAGTRREPVDEAFITPLMARSREALGAKAFDTAEAAGQALSYEASMAEVNQWLQRDA